jgi:fructoselysine-6-P-deglycase FrlB-like protein
VSATNEELRGEVKVLTYGEGGTRGEAETTSIVFIEASAATPLTFHST